MTKKQPCPICDGSGQISFFKGVSRFLISSEECPECAGLGFRLEHSDQEHTGNNDRPPSGGPKNRALKQSRNKDR